MSMIPDEFRFCDVRSCSCSFVSSIHFGALNVALARQSPKIVIHEQLLVIGRFMASMALCEGSFALAIAARVNAADM